MGDINTQNGANQDSEVVSDVVRKAFALAANYEHVINEFPVEAVQFLLRKLGLRDHEYMHDAAPKTGRTFTILEVGCGTGKFTRAMLEVLKGKNVKVVASEPLQSMCDQFRLMVPDTEIIRCPAEKIPLPDGSVDAVVAARSFHFFTNRAALEEIHRVLAPNGSLGITWSLADLSFPWGKDVAEFLKVAYKECSLVVPNVHPEEWIKVFSALSQNLFCTPEEFVGFEYSIKSSFEHAFNLFASYSPIAGGSEGIKKEFSKVFDEITKKHFKEKDVPFDAIQFKIHMYWCTKQN